MEQARRLHSRPTAALAVHGMSRLFHRAGETETEAEGMSIPANRKRLYLIVAILGVIGLAAMVAILVYVLL